MPCKRGIGRDNSMPTYIHSFFIQLKSSKLFGFAEVDFEIPKPLWPKFEEICCSSIRTRSWKKHFLKRCWTTCRKLGVRLANGRKFQTKMRQWLPWDKHSNRTPGVFKLGHKGPCMMALCLKCYFVESEKNKTRAKGMSKAQKELTWRRSSDSANNRVFWMHKGKMKTYEQHNLGLSAYSHQASGKQPA